MRYTILSTAALLFLGCFFFIKGQPDPPDRADRITRTPRKISHAADPLPPPLQPVTPTKLGIRPPKPVTDHAAHLRELIAAGDTAAIQSATLQWFQKEPDAARRWIMSQPNLATLEPAVSYIANHIGDTGSLGDALDFAEIIPSEDLRNQTYHEILALALRNGKITLGELDLTGLPQGMIEDLASGAALD